MRRDNSKLFFGVVVLLLGVVILLGKLRIFNFDFWSILWKLWPLVLVGFGVNKILSKNVVSGMIISVIGLLFLISTVFNFNIFSYFWPIVLIGVGLSIIFNNEEEDRSGYKTSMEDRLNDSAIFWGTDKKLESSNFAGGKIDVVFGGYELDLRDVKIAKNGAKLEVNAIFGGAEIVVPKDCRVITNGNGFFGGWESNLKSRDVKKPILEISGSVVFGGVEVKE